MTVALIFLFVTRVFGKCPTSCLDILGTGQNDDNGYYQIINGSGKEYTVYCDFKSEKGSAWTLISSHTLENKIIAKKGFTLDYPANENSPNFNIYRMKKENMEDLRNVSTHWRATCQFDRTLSVDYRDYMRGNFAEFDILTYEGEGLCKKVEFLNIRGHIMIHGSVSIWQSSHNWGLHTDSSAGPWTHKCDFNGAAGSDPNEDNFGLYGACNANFRCSADA